MPCPRSDQHVAQKFALVGSTLLYEGETCSMKIAFVSDDGITISRHFGRATYYVVVEIENGTISHKEIIPNQGIVHLLGSTMIRMNIARWEAMVLMWHPNPNMQACSSLSAIVPPSLPEVWVLGFMPTFKAWASPLSLQTSSISRKPLQPISLELWKTTLNISTKVHAISNRIPVCRGRNRSLNL